MELLKQLNNELGGRASICGGCFRSLREGNEPKDIDIFLLLPSYSDYCREVLKNFTGLDEVETTYSWEYGKYTLIKPFINKGRKLFGRADQIIKEFDIDVTRMYMDRNGNIASTDFIYREFLYNSIDKRECTITLFDGHEQRTTKRINKYIGYGYNVKQVEFSKLEYSVFYTVGDTIHIDGNLSGMCYNDL